LKAKARLWSLLASAFVFPGFAYAAWLYPASTWKIALVALGWLVFARSLAEKAVTLANVTSESGETQKTSWGLRWAVTLGTLSFAIGVFTQQWAVAVAGIVYSIMTAGAMWQNFRARLPYLLDPWSEKPPVPPTLMHGMIAISGLAEGTTVLTASMLAFVGRENFAVAQSVSYGFCAVIVSLIVMNFLHNRDVSVADIMFWRKPGDAQAALGRWSLRRAGSFPSSLLLGAALGLALGLLGLGYLALLREFPTTAEILDAAAARRAALPNIHTAYLVIAVAFAPAAEEYLFRGLLYRTLDREWGSGLAILASAAFFVIYHPFLSWLPVGLVGIAAALIFKRTGNLASAIALHTVYNAIVVS
jgi:membrane protease YdiL (CAAX protease family)